MNELAILRSPEQAVFWTPEWALQGTSPSPDAAPVTSATRLIEPLMPIGTALSIRKREAAPSPTVQPAFPGNQIERKLFDALAAMKIKTAEVAMHLSSEWRSKLFSYLDFLHDINEWDECDEPATLSSFTTFLRMIMHIRPAKRPGMGLTTRGHLIATWTVGNCHLTIECGAGDEVLWSVAVPGEDQLETATGRCNLTRLIAVLAPYQPEQWFANGQ